MNVLKTEQRQLPFCYPDIGEEEIGEVAGTLRSGWITTGPRTKQFEREIAASCGTDMAVCLNSASACMELVLRLLQIGPGDEVITSAYTYTASASVICHTGAKPVLIDTAPGSYEMDYDKLSDAVTTRTKAVIPVDIAGKPCDYLRINQALSAKKHLFTPRGQLQQALGRIAVVSDAAHAFGARWHGKPMGSVADFVCFSFHAVKNLTTAEGGAVVWRGIPGIENDEIYRRFQLMSLHGQSKDALSKTKHGQWEYDIVCLGHKCNMTDIAAALGLRQLKRYSGILNRRRSLIRLYDKMLKPAGIEVLGHYADERISSGHLYLTRIPGIDESGRGVLIARMAERGIACNVHYKPLPMMTAYRQLGFNISDFPNAYAQYKNEITLPLHSCLTDEDADYISRQYIAVAGRSV